MNEKSGSGAQDAQTQMYEDPEFHKRVAELKKVRAEELGRFLEKEEIFAIWKQVEGEYKTAQGAATQGDEA